MPQPIYRNTDAGAPVIDNNAGSMCNVLDAVLVNGYGSKPSLGWSIKYTATNKRVYKMGGGTGFELRIDETLNVYNAAARGAESFSGIDTYTGGFPTAAQAVSGNFWIKTDNTAGARSWVITGDNKRFCMIVEPVSAFWKGFFFGDIVSFKPGGDPFCCMIFGGYTAAASNVNTGDWFAQIGPATSTAYSTHFIARAHSGVGSAIQNGKYSDYVRMQASIYMGNGGMPYPEPITGGLHLSRLWVGEQVAAPRGYIPGLWVPCHDRTSMAAQGIANGDTFSGSDGLASRTFEFKYIMGYDSGQKPGAICFETSNWPESA